MKVGDLEVGRIGLGTNRLTRTPANVAFIKAAIAAGVRMIDTAHLYTGGQSEETIGKALHPLPDSFWRPRVHEFPDNHLGNYHSIK